MLVNFVNSSCVTIAVVGLAEECTEMYYSGVLCIMYALVCKFFKRREAWELNQQLFIQSQVVQKMVWRLLMKCWEIELAEIEQQWS